MLRHNGCNMVRTDNVAFKTPLLSFATVSAAFGSLSNQFVVFSRTMQMTVFLLFFCFHVVFYNFFFFFFYFPNFLLEVKATDHEIE